MGTSIKGPTNFPDDLPFVFKQAILQSLDTYEHAVSVVVKYRDRDVMSAFIEQTRKIVEQGLNALVNDTDYEKVE